MKLPTIFHDSHVVANSDVMLLGSVNLVEINCILQVRTSLFISSLYFSQQCLTMLESVLGSAVSMVALPLTSTR